MSNSRASRVTVAQHADYSHLFSIDLTKSHNSYLPVFSPLTSVGKDTVW
jgi:hypothetical protein